mmetsp:Transcript_17923/g.29982  ORF Transcript_17923/g.29982 Transcript_17923/m.29982 type:complete len:258 (-) Transcript_17923:615-1388(-)
MSHHPFEGHIVWLFPQTQCVFLNQAELDAILNGNITVSPTRTSSRGQRAHATLASTILSPVEKLCGLGDVGIDRHAAARTHAQCSAIVITNTHTLQSQDGHLVPVELLLRFLSPQSEANFSVGVVIKDEVTLEQLLAAHFLRNNRFALFRTADNGNKVHRTVHFYCIQIRNFDEVIVHLLDIVIKGGLDLRVGVQGQLVVIIQLRILAIRDLQASSGDDVDLPLLQDGVPLVCCLFEEGGADFSIVGIEKIHREKFS